MYAKMEHPRTKRKEANKTKLICLIIYCFIFVNIKFVITCFYLDIELEDTDLEVLLGWFDSFTFIPLLLSIINLFTSFSKKICFYYSSYLSST